MSSKVVVITGASGNLGLALCQHFAQAGWRVAALDISAENLEKLAHYLATKQLSILTAVNDVTNRNACLSAVQQILQHWGRIDVLINNAGITHIQPFREMDKGRDMVRRVMEVNLLGAVYMTEACLDAIISQKGVVVGISSVAGFAPLWGRTAYAASKHALHGFFNSLRTELVQEGVACLLVCPSFIAAHSPILDLSSSAIYQDKKTAGKPIMPDFAAQKIYEAVLRRRRLLIVGGTGKMAYWLSRLFPAWYERIMLKRIGK